MRQKAHRIKTSQFRTDRRRGEDFREAFVRSPLRLGSTFPRRRRIDPAENRSVFVRPKRFFIEPLPDINLRTYVNGRTYIYFAKTGHNSATITARAKVLPERGRPFCRSCVRSGRTERRKTHPFPQRYTRATGENNDRA